MSVPKRGSGPPPARWSCAIELPTDFRADDVLAFHARDPLAVAERVEGAGALLVAAHPAVLAAVRPAWREELARRTGRQVRWQDEPALALDAGYAQLVSP